MNYEQIINNKNLSLVSKDISLNLSNKNTAQGTELLTRKKYFLLHPISIR